MRLIGLTVVTLVGALSAPASAQLQSYHPPEADFTPLKRSLVLLADTSKVQRQLDLARSLYENTCRFRGTRGARRQCRSIRGRISRLERQLSGSARTDRDGDRRYALWGRSFRTICVRVCDGYYYTLSHTASRQRFKQDAEKCTGQYPPGEAVLFYHPFPSDDVSQARSLDGKRYADQEYAFAFRNEFKPDCAAQLHQGLAALKARVFAAVPALVDGPPETSVDESVAVAPVPIPIPRQASRGDPETLANRAGRLSPQPIEAIDRMRTVGDPYYFVEANPGPPPTVAGYVPPELVDFRVRENAAVREATQRPNKRSRDVPLDGAY